MYITRFGGGLVVSSPLKGGPTTLSDLTKDVFMTCDAAVPCTIHGGISETSLPVSVKKWAPRVLWLHLFKCTIQKCVCFAEGRIETKDDATVRIATNGKLVTGSGDEMKTRECGVFVF
jgi:hypothetical protein